MEIREEANNEEFEDHLLAGAAVLLAGGILGTGARAADDPALTKMKADIARSVGPQTTWDGPTTGPKAAKDKSVVYVSLTQNSSGNANSARGAQEAAEVLGWKFTLMDGKGTATGGADALAQAIALKPDAIILGSVSIENNKTLIQQAHDAGHRRDRLARHRQARPGRRSAGLHKRRHRPLRHRLYRRRIRSGPQRRHRRRRGDQRPAVSDRGDEDRRYRERDQGVHGLHARSPRTTRPFGEVPQRTPALISSLLQRFGDKLGYILTFNEVYFDFAVPTLEGGGLDPAGKPHLIAAGDGSESAYQRIRNGQFQIATVPEPAIMHGWQLIDELNRAFNGEPPSGFVTKVHLVTKDNVDADGGEDNRFDPSNDYRGHYKTIWGVQ